jgi:hypothetical protein
MKARGREAEKQKKKNKKIAAVWWDWGNKNCSSGFCREKSLDS